MVSRQSGQSLIEVVIALLVIVVVLGALVVTILTGLKNAQFAQSQVKATKYAQEALDKIRAIRDRDQDGSVSFENNAGGSISNPITRFSDLWKISMVDKGTLCVATESVCYLKLTSSGLESVISSSKEDTSIGGGLSRVIIFKDKITSGGDDGYDQEKSIVVKVLWEDSSGKHESNLETKLTPR